MIDYSNILTPSNCLSKSQLMGYIQKKLDRDEVYLVESHLNDCTLCSDALDGLMEENLETSQNQIKEIRSEIEKKIIDKHPIKKPESVVASKIKKETNEVNQGAYLKPQSKYRWLVAASILLLISLGAYSIVSYIKSQKPELAQNKSSDDIRQTPSIQSNETKTNEVNHLKVNPADNPPAVASKNLTNDKKEKDIVPSSQGKDEKAATPSTDKIKESPSAIAEDIKTPAEYKKITREESDKVAKADENITSNDERDNYNETKKALEPQKQIMPMKKSAGGLSNSKPSNFSNRSNQLSYPSQQNNAAYQNNTAPQPETATKSSAKDSENELSDYENAMQYYNQGEYKKSIPYFEKALKNAGAAQKEDIQFQLAQAYLKIGKTNKAERLFEILAAGKKYNSEATEQLQKARK